MIEWVPFDSFDPTGEDTYLVCYKDQHGKNHIVTRFNYVIYHFDKSVTHAAKINFPVEKTLEEKFKEYHLSKVGWSSQDRDVYKGLAEIAKQHYEGKK